MTTEAAAKFYLEQHLHAVAGKKYAVYNPHNKPLHDLPFIYGFNNGGGPTMGVYASYQALAISEDGKILGEHICSDEAYMPSDLGILEDTRPDRHAESYQQHYPDGYRMEFVPYDAIPGHEGLQQAMTNGRKLLTQCAKNS